MKPSVACLAFALLFAWSGMAQEERQLIRVVQQQVSPPMLDEWVDLQKQYVAGAKAAGLPGRAVWQTLIGPTNQFTTAMLVDGLGYFDPDPQRPRGMSPEAWQRWLARAREVHCEPGCQRPHGSSRTGDSGRDRRFPGSARHILGERAEQSGGTDRAAAGYSVAGLQEGRRDRCLCIPGCRRTTRPGVCVPARWEEF